MRISGVLTLVVALCAGAVSAQVADTWVKQDGSIFEASVQKVEPGTVTFVLKDGSVQAVALKELSERSRGKLWDALGFSGTPIQAPVMAAAAATGGSGASAGAGGEGQTVQTGSSGIMISPTGAVSGASGDEKVIEVTDAAALAAAMGQVVVVRGVVVRVVTLGAAGHRLLEFENSDFNVFISKQALDRSADWILDDLEGKWVTMSGKLEEYRDKPQIKGDSPEQLKRVD